MNNFIVENEYLVLSKYIKTTQKDDKGNVREYGSIGLYCKDTDEFQRISIFDNYKTILDKYDLMKTYKIKLQISIVTKDNKSTTYIRILQ